MYVSKSVKEISHLHVLTDDNTISCLNEVKDQKTGARQHHREEMGTATDNGTYNILKKKIQRCVTIARQTKTLTCHPSDLFQIVFRQNNEAEAMTKVTPRSWTKPSKK